MASRTGGDFIFANRIGLKEKNFVANKIGVEFFVENRIEGEKLC